MLTKILYSINFNNIFDYIMDYYGLYYYSKIVFIDFIDLILYYSDEYDIKFIFWLVDMQLILTNIIIYNYTYNFFYQIAF